MSKRQKKNKGKNKTQHKTTATSKVAVNNSSFWINKKLHLIIIAAVAGLLYANTLGCDYTWDDAIVITENEFTTSANLGGIFGNDTFRGFFGEDKNLVAGGRYRPLTLAMFAIEYQLSKRPFIGHLFNILWYALTGIVLYLLLLKMLNPQEKPERLEAWFIAFAASLLFVAHPIHTEAVSNIKGRDEIITLLGSLAGLYFAFRAYHEEKNVWMILSGLVFFLGLLAKENAITFLAVVPLAFYFFTDAKTGSIVKHSLPFVAAAALFMLIRTAVIGFDMGSASNPDLMNNPFVKLSGSNWVFFSAGEKMATIMFTLGKYIQLLFAPYNLTHDYYPRQIDIMTFGNWKVLLSLLAYVGMGVYALLRLRKKDLLSFGILFFLITLSIVSNIVFPIGTNMSERFMFMPSVGWAIVVATLLWRLAKYLNKKEILSAENLKAAVAVLGVIVVLFGIKTVHRNFAWKDNFTLFSTDIKTSTNSAKLLNAMGGELSNKAIQPESAAQKAAMLAEAKGYLDRAVAIHPTYANAYLIRGNVNNYTRQYDAAIQDYNTSMAYKVGYVEARNNLAITHRDAAAYILEQKSDVDKVPRHLEKSLTIFTNLQNEQPDYPDINENMGIAYRYMGRYYGEILNDAPRAIGSLLKSQQYNKDDDETLRLLALSYGLEGRHNKTIETLNKLLAKKPNSGLLHLNLSTAYALSGNEQKAAEFRAKAYQLDPGLKK